MPLWGARLEGPPCARRASDVRRTRAAAAPANPKLGRGAGAALVRCDQGGHGQEHQAGRAWLPVFAIMLSGLWLVFRRVETPS